MLARNQHEVTINRPVDQVFRSVTDLTTWHQWHPSGHDVEKSTPGPIGVGTIWKVSGRMQNQPVTMAIEFTAYESNRQFAFQVTGPIQARQSFTFEPVADGTRLASVLELNAEIAQGAHQQWERDLLTLKQLLEAQAEGNP